MNPKFTSNNIPFETNWSAKIVSILPIKEVHTLNQLAEAKNEIDAKYATWDVQIDWQKN